MKPDREDQAAAVPATVVRARGVFEARSVKKYLKPFRILGRWTTFNGSCQAALAVPETYDEAKVREGLRLLGQPGEGQLSCVYCGAPAATWDHLKNIVADKKYSGFGHRIFNLVPACRTCNERKGRTPWREFLERRAPPDQAQRAERLAAFEAQAESEQFGWPRIAERFPEMAAGYERSLTELRALLERLDRQAGEIRAAVQAELAGTESAAGWPEPPALTARSKRK